MRHAGVQKWLGIKTGLRAPGPATRIPSPTNRRGSARSPLRHLAGAADRRMLRRWTRPRSRPVDQLLVKLSEAADHSVLWLVLAAAGASVGGRRGRRAATSGIVALMFSSAMVNGPLKLLVGRRRPTPHRRIRRMPRTASFPSGHTASAFAFAVAASRELPGAGPVLLPLAAGVAYSRVYLGLHYPGDVLAGAAFGTVVGVVTPTVRHQPVGRAGDDARDRQAAPVSRAGS